MSVSNALNTSTSASAKRAARPAQPRTRKPTCKRVQEGMSVAHGMCYPQTGRGRLGPLGLSWALHCQQAVRCIRATHNRGCCARRALGVSLLACRVILPGNNIGASFKHYTLIWLVPTHGASCPLLSAPCKQWRQHLCAPWP